MRLVSSLNETRLLSRIAAGDGDALGKIIEKYSGYVQTIASNITVPPLQAEDVEEIAADVFLTLWSHADAVEEGRLKSYLAAITRNLAKNRLRYLHLTVPLEDEYMLIRLPDLEEQIDELFIRQLTRSAVDALPEPERSIFQRYYFLYQKTDEIAATLRINPATVRTKLARGREKLKAELIKRGYSCEVHHC